MARYLVFVLVVSLFGGACQNYRNLDPYEGTPCSGHGTYYENNGEAGCICDEGYAGDLCGECRVGYQDEGGVCVVNEVCDADSCSGRGVCDDSTGVPTCTCETGHSGDHCESCSSGYQDNDGDGACLASCATSGLDCGPNGSCDDSGGEVVCTCDEVYAGDLCDECSYSECNGTCCADREACQNGSCCMPAECESPIWVTIQGGSFMMGSDIIGWDDERPVHQVDVPAFEMTMTEVTVAQYQACVDDGECTEPNHCGSWYNWGVAGREDHPVNCVDWFQAVDFCSWMGGRLPSEAEWEYAARGGGQDITYPWGEDSPSCTYAVMYEGWFGCGMDRTWAVCSKTAGNTAQGLCDMAGNVWEWVQDWYHSDYNGAPSDGSAWETPGGRYRVGRGGSFGHAVDYLRASNRYGNDPLVRYGNIGFRCAR